MQGTLRVLVSIPLGLRAPFLGVVLTLIVIALLGSAFASVSYALALTLKSEDAFAPLLNAFVLPVLLLSGILLPMTLAAGWLQAISDVNPLTHVVEGTREFFVGGYGTSVAWWGAALTVALAVLGWMFGVRRFRRAVRLHVENAHDDIGVGGGGGEPHTTFELTDDLEILR